MIEIEILRQLRGSDFTQGILMIDGVYFCHTLEPRWRNLRREEKVKGKTAIPAGSYKVMMAPSQKFKKVMPYLMDVPGFQGVMMHVGNTSKDTEGCILVGRPYVITGNPIEGTIASSAKTFYALMEKLKAEKKAITITINEPEEWKQNQ